MSLDITNKYPMKLDGLTVIRFLAALWVFVFHFNLRLPLGAPVPLESIISNGALAMPIFFMLSGLVLHHRYHKNYEAFGNFLRARVIRIYPAYLLGLILSLPFLFSQRWVDTETILFLVPVDILLLQAWYPNLWSFWHHSGSWSISVEFFLYAFFPLLLQLGKIKTKNIFLLCIGCILLASSFIPSLKLGASSDMPFPVYYSIPMYSLPVFVIGVLLSELRHRGFNGFLSAPILFFTVLVFFGELNFKYATLNFVTLPLIALTLLFAAKPRDEQGIFKYTINRYTVYFGEISYAFFVYQIPLMLFLDRNIALARTFPLYITGLLMLVVNFIFAVISHHWVEPWGNRFIAQRWKKH